MYNDELDYALESAYEDGYYQALADMGYELDDVEEDVDIFDEGYFDEAAEGAARAYRRRINKEKSPEEIHNERNRTLKHGDPRFSTKYAGDGRHVSDSNDRIFSGERKRHMKDRDDRVRRYDTEDGYRIHGDVERKYGEKAEKKVKDDYNARTRAQYDALKSKLQSSNLTAAQKRAVMEKFKARKMQEKDDVDNRALNAYFDASRRAQNLHTKQIYRRNGWGDLNI